jgi:anthranilate phosphoribosyltransferase
VTESDELEAHGGWPALLTSLLDRQDLSAAQARAAMATILEGRATPAQLIGFVVALRAKGETPEELSGLLDAVLAAATIVPLSDDLRMRAIDIVGTGGDRSHSINVSTMAAIVTAGAGVPVCKHGARAASSKCGTADVLEALGVVVELPPDGVVRCVEEAGIGFCLAPAYHPAFRFAGPSRREIGIPTVFNLLGPMANGLDELTTTGNSTVLALEDDHVRSFSVDPLTLGLAPAIADELVGGEPHENAEAVRRVLAGDHGAHRNIVVLNAGAALVVADRAASLEEGLAMAAESIDSGAAARALETMVMVSQDAKASAGS